MKKSIAILGSTGSIGHSTLEVLRHLKEDFQVNALCASENIDLLEQQALEFSPKVIGVFNKDKARILAKRLPHIRVLGGMEGLEEVAADEGHSFVVSAIAGTLGIRPTLTAIAAGKDIGLANKEALVSAGGVLSKMVKEKGIQLLPIDSEHSALFQCLRGEKKSEVRRLILTASGGPFRESPMEKLASLGPKEALQHPTWSMGAKVTIDSSTLMNKGLELIEARWLFDIPQENIDVVIHPQSILHSMVEYRDGSVIAQLNEPDMINPIQFALTYPERKEGMFPPFDFVKNSPLTFFEPDHKKFPCLSICMNSLKKGGTYPCFMNAANEIIVQRFLQEEFPWIEIPQRLERLLEGHQSQEDPSIECILEVDSEARELARSA